MHASLHDVKDRGTVAALPFHAPGTLRSGHALLAACAQRTLVTPRPMGAGALFGLAALAMTTGCLITEPPQFTDPPHTRPFLLEATADPDPRRVVVIDTTRLSAQPQYTFSADLISQDDTSGAFSEVRAYVYIDLGLHIPNLSLPYGIALPGTVSPATGSLDQTAKRRAIGTWTPASNVQDVAPGCHTVTLVVSHLFDTNPNLLCPVCADDSSSLTWQILRCSSSDGDCDGLPVKGSRSCADLTNSCTIARAALQAQGGEVQACPSDLAEEGMP